MFLLAGMLNIEHWSTYQTEAYEKHYLVCNCDDCSPKDIVYRDTDFCTFFFELYSLEKCTTMNAFRERQFDI